MNPMNVSRPRPWQCTRLLLDALLVWKACLYGSLVCITAETSQQCAADGSCFSKNNDALDAIQEEQPLECGMYVAESSIPNAGWGMYTAIPLKQGETIGPLDVVVQVSDHDHHMTSRDRIGQGLPRWLMNEYYWNPRFGGAEYEANVVYTITPGLGMLANSHAGLVNSENLGSRHQEGPRDRKQAESGAYSYHTKQKFEANQDLPAGMELFVAYGDSWFEDRANEFGNDLPLSNDYTAADELLESFFDELGEPEQWHKWRDDIAKDEDYGLRVQKALPQTFFEAKHIIKHLKGSTAMHSVPNVVRSMDWLQQNGMCLDHIKLGNSTIPRAGKGAFATRNLPKGAIVSPAPVVHLHRGHLEVLLIDEHDANKVHFRGHQLLLNYVYGHPSSSLVFYPYSPAVNLINHGSGQDANVRLQWSAHTTRPEWFNYTTKQLLAQNSKTGLMMEFVATRDIQIGEEILVDYGDDWQESWNKHVKEWEPPSNADTYIPAAVFNEQDEVRTIFEEPYPSNIQTVCWFDELEDPKFNTSVYRWIETEDVVSDMSYFRHTDEARRCSILKRHGTTYTIRIDWVHDNDEVEQRTVWDVPRSAIAFVDAPYTADDYLRKAFRHYLQLPNEMVPKAWRDLEDKDEPSKETCQLYMAESSIPNSGLGMYTAVEIPEKTDIYYPDMVVQVEDFEDSTKLHNWLEGKHDNSEPLWLLDKYYWKAESTGGDFEAYDVQSIVPGLGMLANSHTGLVNAHMSPPKIDRSGMNRRKDPGVGASTTYHGVSYHTREAIPAGMELFVGYGDSWFKYRTELGVIPLSYDFKKADILLKKFWHIIGGKPDTEFAKDLWSLLWYNGTDQLDGSRVRVALPRELSEVERVVKIGTALNSVPNAIRSPEWLRENGLCLDNIRPDLSTLPQAGQGAFATRFISEGSVVAPAPFVHIHRRHMGIYGSKDVDDKKMEIFYFGKQVLLNYVYGHPKSNLLLFPYAPVTNYINHHHTEFNAELRWSTLPHHHSDWFERSVEDLMKEDHSGVIMEIVSTRDIMEGEEVFLDYGKEWEDAWNEYLAGWKPPYESDEYVAAAEFNDIDTAIKTLNEQESDPYPENVVTVCYIGRNMSDKQEPTYTEDNEVQYEWRYSSGLYDTTDTAYRCDVLSRSKDVVVADSIQPLNTRYTARVHLSDEEYWIVYNVPRQAIAFYDDQYTSDMFVREAFRHEIGIPTHLFPAAWMDRSD